MKVKKTSMPEAQEAIKNDRIRRFDEFLRKRRALLPALSSGQAPSSDVQKP